MCSSEIFLFILSVWHMGPNLITYKANLPQAGSHFPLVCLVLFDIDHAFVLSAILSIHTLYIPRNFLQLPSWLCVTSLRE